MRFRFKLFTCICLLITAVRIPSVALPEAKENGGKPPFFSRQKLINTYSVYRPYLDSLDEGDRPMPGDPLRIRLGVIRVFVDAGMVSDDILTRIFTIENHFAKAIASRIPDYKVEEVYSRENMQELSLSEKQVAALKEMIKSQLYLDDPETIGEAERFLELSVIKKQSESDGKDAPIPLEDLAIKNAGDDACLASTRDDRCLVSVKEFNAFLPYADAQTGRTLAEAREYLLRFYAFRKLQSLEGRTEAPFVDEKAIVQHVQDVQEYRTMRESLRGMGLPVMDPKILAETYQKYFRDYFAKRDSVLMQVLASSDPVHMDSLYRRLVTQSEMRPLPGEKTVPDAGHALPWMTFSEEDLPAELVAPTDTFHVGQFTKPIKTDAGYFITKLSKILTIPSTPPEKAQVMCIYLATRDKYARMDSVLSAKAKRYYDGHPDEFLTPDTAAYRFWLTPRGTYRTVREYVADSARVRPMAKRAPDLPRDVTRNLSGKSIPDSLRLQVVDTRFGQMLVQLQTLKKGGRKIPFAKAKTGILEKLLQAPPAQSASALTRTAADSVVSHEVLFTLGSSDMVYSAITEGANRISEAEIDAAVESGALDASGMEALKKSGQFYAIARKKMESARIDKKQRELQDQLNGILVNTNLLSVN